MKRVALLLFLLVTVFASFGQTVITHPDSLRPELKNRKASILPVPLVQYFPETSLLLGLSTLSTFYADKTDSTNRPSFVFLTGFYTLKKQYVLDAYVNGWTKQNKLHYQVEAAYFLSNYKYYGIGSHTSVADEEYILFMKKALLGNVERKVSNRLYLGAEGEYHYERHTDRDKGELDESTHPGAPGDELARVGASAAYDSRDTYTSATKGSFYKITYSKFMHILGSKANFDQVKFESRNFWKLHPKHILGFNTNFETLQGDNRPFYLLPQMGSSFIQRGYYQGRYREQNYAAAQLEYRWCFYKRFVLVGFLGAGEVYKNKEFNFPDVKPNYGFGFRYLYDKASRIFFRFDYGWGEKVAGESRIGSPYFYIGEAF